MDELTWTSVPVSAAHQRDPSFMTRMPRRAGFQPPLIVVALRLTAVSRDTWAVAGRPGATGPRLTVTGAPAWEAATAPLVSGRWALTGADPPATGPATGGATSIPAASTPAGTMA